MKKDIMLFYIALSIGLFVSACAPAAQEAPTTSISTIAVEEECPTGAFVGNPEEIGGSVDVFGQLLSEYLGCSMVFHIFPDHETVKAELEAGNVDLAMLNARDYLLLEYTLKLVPLFVPVYEEGGAYYRSAFIVRTDSGIKSLNELEGKTIAYTTQESLYGYLLPRAFLSEKGYNPDGLFRETLFIGPSASDVIKVIYNREAEVGVIWADEKGDARQLVADEITDIWDAIEIIDYTPEIPDSVFVLSPDVSDGLREKLQIAIRQVSKDEKGKEALYGIYGIVALTDPDDRFWKAIDWFRYALAYKPSEAPPPEVMLTLTVLKGTVEVNGQTVIGEVNLYEGDSIVTGSNGIARLIFFNDEGISTEIKSNTRIEIEKLALGDVRLYLDEGSLRSTLQPGRNIRFVVGSRAGEIEAIGTVLIIEVDASGDLLVAVLEGLVIARAPGGYEAEVPASQRLEIPLDRPPGLPESTIFVGFDSSLDDYQMDDQEEPDTPTGQYSLLTSELSSTGYIIEEIVGEDNRFYDVLIELYDVLIILDPENEIPPENIDAIHKWVEKGHGLFVVGENANAFAQSSINELLAPYGIRFVEEDPQGESVADLFNSHDITQGVYKLLLADSGALQGGIELGYANSGHLVLSAYENANYGKVVVWSDSDSLMNDFWGGYDGAPFIVNTITWLAKK